MRPHYSHAPIPKSKRSVFASGLRALGFARDTERSVVTGRLVRPEGDDLRAATERTRDRRISRFASVHVNTPPA